MEQTFVSISENDIRLYSRNYNCQHFGKLWLSDFQKSIVSRKLEILTASISEIIIATVVEHIVCNILKSISWHILSRRVTPYVNVKFYGICNCYHLVNCNCWSSIILSRNHFWTLQVHMSESTCFSILEIRACQHFEDVKVLAFSESQLFGILGENIWEHHS